MRWIYDARGHGGGSISPTITGDHQNRITDYTAIVVEDEEEDFQPNKSERSLQRGRDISEHNCVRRFIWRGSETIVVEDEDVLDERFCGVHRNGSGWNTEG